MRKNPGMIYTVESLNYSMYRHSIRTLAAVLWQICVEELLLAAIGHISCMQAVRTLELGRVVRRTLFYSTPTYKVWVSILGMTSSCLYHHLQYPSYTIYAVIDACLGKIMPAVAAMKSSLPLLGGRGSLPILLVLEHGPNISMGFRSGKRGITGGSLRLNNLKYVERS